MIESTYSVDAQDGLLGVRFQKCSCQMDEAIRPTSCGQAEVARASGLAERIGELACQALAHKSPECVACADTPHSTTVLQDCRELRQTHGILHGPWEITLRNTFRYRVQQPQCRIIFQAQPEMLIPGATEARAQAFTRVAEDSSENVSVKADGLLGLVLHSLRRQGVPEDLGALIAELNQCRVRAWREAVRLEQARRVTQLASLGQRGCRTEFGFALRLWRARGSMSGWHSTCCTTRVKENIPPPSIEEGDPMAQLTGAVLAPAPHAVQEKPRQ